MKLINITILFFILNSCTTTTINKPAQSVLLFKDKDGIYLYNATTKTESIVFNATANQVFLDEPYKLANDTLIFGVKGDLTYDDSVNFHGEHSFKDYYTLDLNSGNHWLSEKIHYSVIDHTLKISTQKFNASGDVVSRTDTAVAYIGSSSSSKGITYNEFKPRFFSSSTVNRKTVYSNRGSIYFVENNDTTKLVDFKGNFDPKFGSGFYQPVLDPSGEYVIYRYLPGFMNFKEEASLQKVEIKTKRKSIIKKGEYSNPSFSSDGQFILFERNGRFNKMNCWISDIYILDIATLTEGKIGVANSASWKM